MIAKYISAIGVLLIYLLMNSAHAQSIERWYNDAQANMGEPLFAEHCAVCHGKQGEGAKGWQKRDANGNFPPPPLNGTAHTWHHPLKLLRYTIERGGAPVGGVMPSFKARLNDEQRDAIIAWFQSMWTDEVYANWLKRGGLPEAIKTAAQKSEQTQPAKSQPTPRANKTLEIPQELKATPVNNILQSRIGNQYIYITNDGQYGFVGELINLKTGENLTEAQRRDDRLATMAHFQVSDMAVIPAIGKEKAHITVFTDTSCPFCRKLHKEVPQLSKAGITVRYIPFPRGGKQGLGDSDLRSVWCTKDRAQAMNIAKGTKEGLLGFGDCNAAKAVDDGLKLAIELGLRGTPAIILPSGELISGYRPAGQLIKKLFEKPGN